MNSRYETPEIHPSRWRLLWAEGNAHEGGSGRISGRAGLSLGRAIAAFPSQPHANKCGTWNSASRIRSPCFLASWHDGRRRRIFGDVGRCKEGWHRTEGEVVLSAGGRGLTACKLLSCNPEDETEDPPGLKTEPHRLDLHDPWRLGSWVWPLGNTIRPSAA